MIFKVELEAQDWQQVLNLLAQGRYDQVAPLIGKISSQLQAGPSSANGIQPPAPPPGGNLEQ